MQNHKWIDHKRSLVEKGLINPVFASLSEFLINLVPTQDFEPLLISRHAQRLSELIDRCLALRKDIRDLEVLEVKAATDYVLFNETSALDQQIEILRLQLGSKADDEAGFHQSLLKFVSSSTLEGGIIELVKGRNAALLQDISDLTSIKGFAAQRWASMHQYQDAYHARYTQPGNAHNYGERAVFLLNVMTVLMTEALQRATALAAGIHQIYGVQLNNIPTTVDLMSLDDFAVWSLKVLQSLSRVAEQEVLSDVVIPLVQPWFGAAQPLIRDQDFNAAIAASSGGAPAVLTFSLPIIAPLDSNIRLKSIGLSFGNQANILGGTGIDRNQTADTFTRLTVVASTPSQLAVDGTAYLRPPLLLGNVGLHGMGGGAAMDGPPVENLSPFGQWTLQVSPFIVWKDGTKQTLAQPDFSDAVKDFKLNLKFFKPGPFLETL